MVSVLPGAHWRRVLAAAARLALVYALSVAILIGTLIGITGDLHAVLRYLQFFAGPGALVFAAMVAIAFALLAAARRAGFAALWLLLCGLWAWLLVQMDLRPWVAEGPFVSWSLMAMPLFVIGAIGTSRPRTGDAARRRRPSADLIAFAAWIALLIPAVAAATTRNHYRDRLSVDALGFLLGVAWMVAPVIITAFALMRVWIATGRVLAER